MTANVEPRVFFYSISAIGFCLAVNAMAVLAAPVNAQATGQFRVTVNLQPANSNNRSCISGSKVSAIGAMGTTTCATATGLVTDLEVDDKDSPSLPRDNGTYLFIYLANVDLLGTKLEKARMDNYGPIGSVTTWRLVHLPYLNYAEMQIGW
jgi:hypothetical protein